MTLRYEVIFGCNSSYIWLQCPGCPFMFSTLWDATQEPKNPLGCNGTLPVTVTYQGASLSTFICTHRNGENFRRPRSQTTWPAIVQSIPQGEHVGKIVVKNGKISTKIQKMIRNVQSRCFWCHFWCHHGFLFSPCPF